jgi:uncharacterized membrane protein YgcG
MKKLLYFLSLASLNLAAAEVPSKPSGKVWDPDDIFTQAQEHQISGIAAIPALDVVVVGVNSLSPYETASAYAEALYAEWKLGSSDNMNGLLIVVAKSAPHSRDQRDLCRIMTGWDTMKRLPDSVVIGKIKHERMMIHLPEKPFEAVIGALNGVREFLPATETAEPESKSYSNGWWWFFGIIGGLIVIAIISTVIGSSNSSSSGYYSGSSKKNDNSSSGGSSCGTASGCGGGGCGGGGCGGGGCGS